MPINAPSTSETARQPIGSFRISIPGMTGTLLHARKDVLSSLARSALAKVAVLRYGLADDSRSLHRIPSPRNSLDRIHAGARFAQRSWRSGNRRAAGAQQESSWHCFRWQSFDAG